MFPILKLLTPTVLNAIVKYVFEKNDLDHQMEAVIDKVSELEKKLNRLDG